MPGATSMTSLDDGDLAWPPAQPVPSERVLSGDPHTSTVRHHQTEHAEFGRWTVTPGSFTTVRDGQDEYIYVIDGDGDLVSADGVVTRLGPGVSAVLADGWAGRWDIRTPLTKVYTLINTGKR